ncbi:MAG: T9SS type A sorting domain-containing protein [Bacteroidetes bacterium]|nr:T9SS type A sorting domain-containing protein [Bacteroidota bacterium]
MIGWNNGNRIREKSYIDVSKLSAGVYFVKLTTQSQQIFSEKFVKIY